jgi:hypothetical protein
LRAELAPLGLEIVTVALDSGGIAAAKPWIDAAAPEHPSLLDEAHVTDELLGFVNVPSAVWINEGGVIVRPAHVAQVQGSAMADAPIPEGLPERLRDTLTQVRKIPRTATAYLPALRDWATKGAESKFSLDADQVIARSQPRGANHAQAAASFELGQHHWRLGNTRAAVGWFRQAHALHPENWTYKRQAWTLATTPEASGAENYYAPLDFD